MENTKKRNLARRVAGKAYRGAKRIALDLNAYYNFMTERSRAKKKPKDRKIRVGFIVQYIPAWNKSESLYKLLKSDDRFETFLLCVQNGIEEGKLIDTACKDNDVYDWFIEYEYSEAINTYEGNERWLDLEGLELDYIFYPRPYNHFMPKQYWSRYVSRYTKICHVMYGMFMTKDVLDNLLTSKDFFRNCYLYISETDEIRKLYINKYSLYHKLGMTDSLCTGFTFINQVLLEKNNISIAWNFSHGNFKVLWTPRWTTDLKLGGSNFFTYKDSFVKYAENNMDCDILIRPHPLMFDHFIKTGELSENEKNAYFKKVDSLKNVCFDFSKEYNSTFWNSDVLVCDISGILPEYFITGKPMIFCATNFILKPLEHTKDILSACYIAHSEEELFEFMTKLKNGYDPLSEQREKIVRKMISSSINSEQIIIDRLLADA